MEGFSAGELRGIDPVCGMEVRSDRITAVYEGSEYHFCSEHCRSRFLADPQAYATPRPVLPDRTAEAADMPSAASGAAVIHTCPMHPEVRREGPGSCPICGMALEPASAVSAGEEDNPELTDMSRRFRVSLAFAAPLLAVAMGDMLPGAPVSALLPGRSRAFLELALAAPVCIWAAWPFFVRAYRSIVHRSLNMFTLIGLGVAVSFVYSLVATLAPGAIPPSFRDAMTGEAYLYFEASAVIVTLVLMGQVLELRARSRTGTAVRKLLSLAPKTARRLEADGSEVDVPLGSVMVGDRLRVRPGEKVPVDGIVEDGSGVIDESMISGEPMPVRKQKGDTVIGGTIAGNGSFIMSAGKVGADTLLARIVEMVDRARRTKAPIQRMADRVSSWFVPAVVAVAIASFLIWSLAGPEPRMAHALVNAVAVLIIACPCALGLATPMSIMVATGKGAGAGVLFRNAEAIELMGSVDTLVVDKTGTLTRGRPELVALLPAPGFDEVELLGIAAGLEKGSEHPLAGAVVRAAAHRKVQPAPVTDFEAIPGMGVRGSLGGTRVLLGNRFLLDAGGVVAGALGQKADAMRSEGRTVVLLASGAAAIGILGIADPVRKEAAGAIGRLRRAGIRMVMLTGDGRGTAEAVAQELGIDEVHAEVLPDRKAEVVRELQASGAIVAMAGDGINDAPALAQADVGIAMGDGTDIAMETADVTLVRGDLGGIVRARILSRATLRNIRQNLFFALLYNSVCVPVAAGVLYPFWGLLLSPMIGAAAMSFSSVSVIANALRLRRVNLQPGSDSA